MGESNQEKKPKGVVQCAWREKSPLERNLIYALIVIIALFIALLLFVIIKPAVTKHKCSSKACLIAASDIIQQINQEIDPCQNFAKFACGGLKKLPTSQNNKIQNIEDGLLEILREPVEESDHIRLRNEKLLYQACLDDNDNDIDAINNTIGELGWPVVVGYQWRDETFDWQQLIFKLRKIGYSFEMMLQVKVVKEGPAYTIKVSPPQIVNITKSVDLYKKFMADVAVFFGADAKRAENEMERVFYFAQYLKKISDFHAGSVSTTVRNYLDDNADIDWLKYINDILYPVKQLALDDYAQFPKKEFTNEFHNLIYRTPKRVIANYIIWSALEKFMPFMSRRLREKKNNYECQTKTNEAYSREIFCKRTLQSFLPMSMHVVYTRRHLSKTKRLKIKTMFETVRDTLIDTLTKKLWLDEVSRNQSIYLLQNCVDVIGMSGDFFNDTIFQENSWPGDYNKSINSDSFLQMVLSENFKLQNNYFYKIGQKSIQNNVYSLLTSKHTSYDLESNAIILPIAVLEEKFFGTERPMYLNYGMLGNTIANELIRAIIESGSEYDKNGDENSIWSKSTRENYGGKIKCFKEAIKELLKNWKEGEVGIEDTVADYSSIKLAYATYKNWTKSNKRENLLNGISYDSKQLFWMSSISDYCLNTTSQRSNLFTLIQNDIDYARDFNCPIESTMRLSENCQIF